MKTVILASILVLAGCIFAGRTKTTRLGGSSAQAIATALLSELVGGD